MELGIFAVAVTSAGCAFALKFKSVLMDISQKIVLQKHEFVINLQKVNSCAPS